VKEEWFIPERKEEKKWRVFRKRVRYSYPYSIGGWGAREGGGKKGQENSIEALQMGSGKRDGERKRLIPLS